MLAAAIFLLMPPPDPHIAARDFLRALDRTQTQTTVRPLTDPLRFRWNYVPLNREGVNWGQMNPTQRAAAQTLLKSALSDAGYKLVEQIRQLELILRELENQNLSRDPDKYHFLIFGTPGPQGEWSWRYEGHHISLNFAYRDGRLVASTPQFIGSNPAVPERTGQDPLAATRDQGFALLNALDDAQRARAVIQPRTLGEIATTNARHAVIEGRVGLSFAQLNSEQRRIFMDIIAAHAAVQTTAEAQRRTRQIALEDLDRLVFAWMGSPVPGAPHYYRIQGDNVLIEYDNSQDGGHHIHTVWRVRTEDFGGDGFGPDALADHYRHGHSHHHHR